MQRTATIHQRSADGVLWVTLARPDQLNALDEQLVSELEAVVASAALQPPRVLVLGGSGRAFCAGVDLKAVQTALGDSSASDEQGPLPGFLARLLDTMEALEALPCPTVAMVNGAAIAGGLELMLACDLAVAARSAVLCDGHARYGLAPGGGASQRLPRIVGQRRALHLMLTGVVVSADEAQRIGLVNVVVGDDELETATEALARDLAGRSASGSASIKRLARLSFDVRLAEGLAAERRDAAHRLFSADVREGLAAFADRREPRFSDEPQPYTV